VTEDAAASKKTNTKRSMAAAFGQRRQGAMGGRRPSAPTGETAPATPRRRRAKTGKRSNPSYTQVSALVMKDVKARFAVAQAQAGLDEGRDLEFGELINLLMAHFAAGNVEVDELRASLGEVLEG